MRNGLVPYNGFILTDMRDTGGGYDVEGGGGRL